MILSTTPQLNHPIKKYLGIVSGEAAVGKALLAELVGGTRDLLGVGGRSSDQETKLADAREFALEDLRMKAQLLKADAVIGVDLDIFPLHGTAVCVATGTAVLLDRNSDTPNPSTPTPRRSLQDY
jgi:uncharacterized protein YbjQ (UPF0145 family)